jgi:hypothetical protein
VCLTIYTTLTAEHFRHPKRRNKMKTTLKNRLVCFIGIVALAIFAFAVNASADYIETFSTDNASWCAERSDQSLPAATYNSTGGNGGGYVSGDLSESSTFLYDLQALQPTGASLYQPLTGKTLTTDFKIDGEVTTNTPLVRFYVGSAGNYWLSNDASSWDPDGDTNWTTHQVALDAANFIQWTQYNTNLTFAQVIASPDDIGLAFYSDGNQNVNGVAGTGTLNVDNFGTVPEPGTLTLLSLAGLSGLAMMWIRRRQSSG